MVPKRRCSSIKCNVGDRLRVRPVRKCRLTAWSFKDAGAVDESMVTGESMPVTKEVGHNCDRWHDEPSPGAVIEARKVGRDTMLSQDRGNSSRKPSGVCADPADGRPGVRWFVPGRDRHRRCWLFVAWAILAPTAFLLGPLRRADADQSPVLRAWVLRPRMSDQGGSDEGRIRVLIKKAEALEYRKRSIRLVSTRYGT